MSNYIQRQNVDEIIYPFPILTQITLYYTHQKSLATLDGEIVDPEITVKLEMRDVPQVHDAQT